MNIIIFSRILGRRFVDLQFIFFFFLVLVAAVSWYVQHTGTNYILVVARSSRRTSTGGRR
jgi:hypothetical protein